MTVITIYRWPILGHLWCGMIYFLKVSLSKLYVKKNYTKNVSYNLKQKKIKKIFKDTYSLIFSRLIAQKLIIFNKLPYFFFSFTIEWVFISKFTNHILYYLTYCRYMMNVIIFFFFYKKAFCSCFYIIVYIIQSQYITLILLNHENSIYNIL